MSFTNTAPPRQLGQYVNLNKSYQPTRGIEAVKFSYAQVLMQLEASDQTRILREDSRQYLTFAGTVYPDDRHFLVSESVSTSFNYL